MDSHHRVKVYAELHLPTTERDRLLSLPDADVWLAQPDSRTNDDARAFAQAEVALGNCDPAWLSDASGLRWLQLCAAGTDGYRELDWAHLSERLVVTSLRGMFADPVAQTCLAGILALYRGTDSFAGLRATRTWDKSRQRPRLRLLTGANVLILGAGAIADRITELLAPFQCRVRRYARTSGDFHMPAELDRHLPDTDILIAAVPDTPATRGLVDARRLTLLPNSALFVNVGRGSLVDETAVARALHAGRLSGAVLDTTRTEPLATHDPLWDCPNIVLTQHTAGGYDREAEHIIDVFVDNWQRYTTGQPLRHQVDWSRDY